jgi:outer membrane lipoprotein-sorting protein
MCSDCGEEEFEAEEAEVDTEAPRTLRGRTKIRKPGKYRHSTDSRDGDLKIVCDGIIDPNRPETQMVTKFSNINL